MLPNFRLPGPRYCVPPPPWGTKFREVKSFSLASAAPHVRAIVFRFAGVEFGLLPGKIGRQLFDMDTLDVSNMQRSKKGYCAA